MENKTRNEMMLDLAGEKILLRPTFDNLAAMESKMGGIAYLAFKFGGGVEIASGKISQDAAAKAMPSMTDAAQIIYFNQAEKKFTQEEIFEMCLNTGLKVCAEVVMFLARVSAGNKFAVEPTDSQKKSSTP